MGIQSRSYGVLLHGSRFYISPFILSQSSLICGKFLFIYRKNADSANFSPRLDPRSGNETWGFKVDRMVYCCVEVDFTSHPLFSNNLASFVVSCYSFIEKMLIQRIFLKGWPKKGKRDMEIQSRSYGVLLHGSRFYISPFILSQSSLICDKFYSLIENMLIKRIFSHRLYTRRGNGTWGFKIVWFIVAWN